MRPKASPPVSSRESNVCLPSPASSPASIAFIAHSTTQATNALLEGDLARVGVLGLLDGSALAVDVGRCDSQPVALGGGRELCAGVRVRARPRRCGGARWRRAFDRRRRPKRLRRARALASTAPAREDLAVEYARARGVDATSGHDVSSAYGLRARTRTAALNAAILPQDAPHGAHDGGGRRARSDPRAADGDAQRRRRDGRARGRAAADLDAALRAGGRYRRRAALRASERRHLRRGRRNELGLLGDPRGTPADAAGARSAAIARCCARSTFARSASAAAACCALQRERRDRRRAAQRAHRGLRLCGVFGTRGNRRRALRTHCALSARPRGLRRPDRARRTGESRRRRRAPRTFWAPFRPARLRAETRAAAARLRTASRGAWAAMPSRWRGACSRSPPRSCAQRSTR